MKILIYIMIFVLIPNYSFATEQFNVSEFIDEVKSYSNDIIPEFEDTDFLSNILNR